MTEARHPQRLAIGSRGMLATQHYLATDAGHEMLEAGGNAFDAAVAAAFALSVCEPNASGLGGQTMLLCHVAGERSIALDGSSRAPNRIVPGSLPKRELLRGHQATTVPSTPAVLDYVRGKYGTKSLGEVLGPAIRVAEEGYPITELQRSLARRELTSLRAGSAGAVFLREGARTHPKTTLLKQPALAATLRRLARRGVEDFYSGQIARQIHADMRKNGGFLHRDDLAQIPWPIERRPISVRFRGARVHTFPPPGAGRTLAQILKLIAELPEELQDPDRPRGAVALAEVIRRAFLDRRDRPFDPAFFPQVDEKQAVSDDYVRLAAKQITKRVKSSGETTSLSAMDDAGNAVVLTQSIERVFGSFELCPELGFLYNNYMSAFEYEDITHPYYLRPNAVPWASVAPTVAFRGRRPWLAIGSPGSERIASSIAQVMMRLGKQSPLDAVSAPRLHCSLNGRVSLESSRMRDDVPRLLARRGFTVDEREPFAFSLGCVQLVMRERKSLIGVADPRRDGSARGLR